MSDKKIMVALDCGNSSFRTVVGIYENGRIETTVVDQIPNAMTEIGGEFYWDMLLIFREFKNSLRKIAKDYDHIASIGICTWGVDFALFDKEGHMLGNPLSYRNTIGEAVLSKVPEEDRKMLFNETGILCDKINSVYMLTGMKDRFPTIMGAADRCLMVPDILNYFMTGRMVNEPSELSTTQLMSARTRQIEPKVCEYFGLDGSLFGEIGVHGEAIGNVRRSILEEIGVDYDIPVICVPSHDTGSAVAAIPAKEKDFGFVSCGTWSLIGTELDEPIITDEVREANLTNEVGAFGRITLLKNNAGMFVVNRLKEEYDREIGRKASWSEVTELAESCKKTGVIDLNDIAFFNPVSMKKAVWDYLVKTGQAEGEADWGMLFMTFYRSLACCYAATLADAEAVTGHSFDKVYIVGGGSASRVLIRETASLVGRPIVVCYGESTSMGNLAVQMKYHMPESTLESLRGIIADSYKTEEYLETAGDKTALEIYRKLTA